MAIVVLGYRSAGCFGWAEAPGGWSFALYQKGTVRFKTYLMNGTVTSSNKAFVPSSVVDKIYHELQSKSDIIEKLPSDTNNRSCDGSYDIFTFLGKKITSLNISRYPEETIQEAETGDPIGAELAASLRSENAILDLFESVAPILSPYGLRAKFAPSFSCEWGGIDCWS
ncbi:MAG: hypothetical protein SPL62_02085 [Selenomonas sp.]|nr:hypothetical protein [Selenomonas sp.]